MAIKKDTLDQLLSGRDPKEVFSKDGWQWKCVHIHISTEPEGQRHEQQRDAWEAV